MVLLRCHYAINTDKVRIDSVMLAYLLQEFYHWNPCQWNSCLWNSCQWNSCLWLEGLSGL